MAPGQGADLLTTAARLTSAFYAWERRGRGWTVWDYAVQLEPPFRPVALEIGPARATDDGRKPSHLGRWLRELLRSGHDALDEAPEPIEEPEAFPANPGCFTAIQVALPPDVKVTADVAEHFLLSLAPVSAPVCFEVVATSEVIVVQFACRTDDLDHVQEQLRAHFPDAVFSQGADALQPEWAQSASNEAVVVDFGLSQEFMCPLRTSTKFDVDPLIAVTGAMTDLAPSETAVLQILFQPTINKWCDEITRAVGGFDGQVFFEDAPELFSLAKEKVEQLLFATVIRVAARGESIYKALKTARRIGGAFGQLARPRSNELIALSNEDYPDVVHAADVLARQTRRTGMLLNAAELVTLVHPPSASVRTTMLARGHRRTKAAPKALRGHDFILGENSHGSATVPVSISVDQRLRHAHIVGASGTGKSTLILNAIIQDMERGNGLALIDPHGDLVEQVLALVPENRIQDVILVDPADTERPVGFNILDAHSDLEKTLLSSDLVAVFRRLSTSWGDQMTSVLSNAILAVLESARGGTLADLRRFLIEKEFRTEFLETVADPEVRYYWQKEFPLLAGRPQAPLLTRLDTFLRPKLVRGMMVQPQNRLDFASIMNEGKILLVKLTQGAIGEENAALLGTLFVAKIHQLALGRQAIAQADRRPFYVYLDEFQHFVTPSMATLLTGARKYGVGLVLAHQELRQLWNQERDVAGAVLANAATRICFRVGDDDAKKLEDGFTSFTARDLQNLGVGQAICRVERAEWDFSLTTRPLPVVDAEESCVRREEIIRSSRERYGGAPPQSQHVPTRAEPIVDRSREQPRSVRTEEPERVVENPSPPVVLGSPQQGRGGSQHKYLQELIRRWAEANNWKAVIEEAILDGLGSVDVALEHGGLRVAMEISVSSTTDYEIGNLQKCVTAGFDHAVSVVVDKRSLQKLKKAVAERLDEATRARIRVVGPEELFEFLNELAAEAPPVAERTTRGYKVRVNAKAGAKSSVPAGQAIARTIISAMRRIGK